MNVYALNEEQLKELIIQANSFVALQQGGVDNWSFCGDALDNAYTEWAEEIGIEDIENKSLYELGELIAEEDLKRYPTIDWKMP